MSDSLAYQDPEQPTAYATADQTAQAAQQVQQEFDQTRSRRNFIQSISKGASTRPGAIRTGISGNG